MKRLIVNPKKKEITKETQILDFSAVFSNLMAKVYQQEEKDFKTLITKEGHIRRFVGNVDPTRSSIQDFAGKEITSYEEGMEYLLKIGTEIYKDPQWTYRLIVNEVKFGRGLEFAMETNNDDIVAKITEALDVVAKVEYNKIKKTLTAKDVKETDEALTDALKEQE